ncbi:MAG: ABC transporter ATP-binding protein [Chloroflexi bacterium]|nr:ABC transporter ATP-binding protein [Chloroflexota bacterium]
MSTIAVGRAGAVANTDADYVVKSEDIKRVYRVDHQEVHALRGANLYAARGEFIAMMGRSGSGKTTLLNIIGGLDHPTDGHIYVYGQDISRMSDRQLTELRRHRIGFVFQSFALMPTMSAYENVELPLRMVGMGRRGRRERVMECLELVGLTRWAKHRPQEMSGGQQQRVAIARALVNRPGLILADEPTGELDSTTGRAIMTLFHTIASEEKVTILMASHDPTVQEYTDYTYHMADGRILNER